MLEKIKVFYGIIVLVLLVLLYFSSFGWRDLYRIEIKNVGREEVLEVQVFSDGNRSPGGYIASGGTAIHLAPDFPVGKNIEVRWKLVDGTECEEFFYTSWMERLKFRGAIFIRIQGEDADFEVRREE